MFEVSLLQPLREPQAPAPGGPGSGSPTGTEGQTLPTSCLP